MSAAAEGVGAAHIEVEDLRIAYGSVQAVKGVSFRVNAGEQLTLLGPSGCGKTTTLRAVAGLEKPSSGTIRIGGEAVYSSSRGVNIPAEKRGLSMVFQSYAIWPHMSVFENVAYGLRVRRVAEQDIQRRVREALDLVQMAPYEQRAASQLSGGQQQRVALARACVFQPSVLLFDEPLSNLDAKLRADMRIELRELQHRLGITSLYVTHDLEEALAMSDRIVVMRDGYIEQTGKPGEIYHFPRTAFVADFVGSSNLIRGKARLDLARDGLIAVETEAGHIVHGVACDRSLPAAPVLSVRTVHLKVDATRPEGEMNIWPATVRHLVFQGDFSQANLIWGNRQIVVRSTALEGLREGSDVFLSVDPRRCVLLEDDGNAAPGAKV